MFRRNPWWKMELIPQLNNPERHGERRGKRHSWMSSLSLSSDSGAPPLAIYRLRLARCPQYALARFAQCGEPSPVARGRAT
jgi:hypothetical protein